MTIIFPSPTSPASQEAARTPERQLIDINHASVELLAALPGIGEGKAQAIVDYRNQEGPFRRTDELVKVPGIGAATYQGLRALVTVGETP